MEEQAGFISALRRHLIENWASYGLQGNPGGLTYRIRQAPKERAAEKARFTALWFQENPEEPCIAAKWVLNKDLFSSIVQEYHHAIWLYETKKLQFLPEPLGCPEILGIPILIEKAVQGRSFAHSLIALEAAQDLGKTDQYLKEILLKAEEILKQIQDPLQPVTKREILEDINPYLLKTQKILEWDEEKSQKIRKTLDSFPLDSVPGSGETFLIGAFAPKNVLSGASGTFLIDLEFSRRSKVAFFDALSFSNSLFHFFHQQIKEQPDKFALSFQKEILEEQGRLGSLIQRFLSLRQISKLEQEWYWLIYFLNEIVCRASISETFPSSHRLFYNQMIDLLVQIGSSRRSV